MEFPLLSNFYSIITHFLSLNGKGLNKIKIDFKNFLIIFHLHVLQIFVVIVDLSSSMRNRLETIQPLLANVQISKFGVVMVFHLFLWDILHRTMR